jgi:PhnB protein
MTAISVMLAVDDAHVAVDWYIEALGATQLWSLGTVAGLEIAGAPFFVAQPQGNGWETPDALGMPSARVEVFVDDPDEVVRGALAAGAYGHLPIDHPMPWGNHRQGGFTDPFGHIWLVGDRTPLNRFPV